MRKAFSLVEILTVIAILGLISIPLAGLTRTTIFDIQRTCPFIQTNTSIQSVIKHIQYDIGTATGLLMSSGEFAAGDNCLLIQSQEDVICYQLQQDLISRQTLTNPSQTDDSRVIWKIPHAKIQWRILRKEDNAYAVELTTCMELRSGDHVEKKMQNSHLFFVGAYPQPIK
jgi:prepilin-type N-terminal cleavage/methylation domain-containing protein